MHWTFNGNTSSPQFRVCCVLLRHLLHSLWKCITGRFRGLGRSQMRNPLLNDHWQSPEPCDGPDRHSYKHFILIHMGLKIICYCLRKRLFFMDRKLHSISFPILERFIFKITKCSRVIPYCYFNLKWELNFNVMVFHSSLLVQCFILSWYQYKAA